MRAVDLGKTILAMSEKNIPAFIWGAPGVGKSSIVKQVATKRGIGFIDLRLALMDPTDLKGIPFYDDEAHSALWAPPAFLPREGEGILFLDELNSAAPSVQASAYQLILDRQVGEYKLPDGWSIIAAGNRESDRGVTYKMPSPLANRFVHLEMDVSVEDWKLWAYETKLCESIIAYISYKPEHLFTFDAQKNNKAFATPRSWSFVDAMLKADLDKTVLLESISGAVGQEVAVSFLSFFKVMHKLPDLKAIIETSKGEYADEVDVLYALSSALVSATLKDETRLDNVLTYSLGLKAEFAVLVVKDLQMSGMTMEHSSAFSEWVKKFSYLLE